MTCRIAAWCSVPLLACVLWAAPLPKDKNDLGPITDEQLKQASENMKNVLLAVHNFESAYGHLPADIVDGDGKAILSWRVMILPYLEEDELYRKFKLDEPWDSKANKELIESIPKIYTPVRGKPKEKGMTFLRGFVGKDAFFEAGRKLRIADIFGGDGASNTVAVVEAGEPCLWTKPEDLPFDADKDLPKLGGQFDGDFHVGMADGSVRLVDGKSFVPKAFKAAITCSSGEVIDEEKAFGKKK